MPYPSLPSILAHIVSPGFWEVLGVRSGGQGGDGVQEVGGLESLKGSLGFLGVSWVGEGLTLVIDVSDWHWWLTTLMTEVVLSAQAFIPQGRVQIKNLRIQSNNIFKSTKYGIFRNTE